MKEKDSALFRVTCQRVISYGVRTRILNYVICLISDFGTCKFIYVFIPVNKLLLTLLSFSKSSIN